MASPLYIYQLSRFRSQQLEQQTTLTRAKDKAEIAPQLLAIGAISRMDYKDRIADYKRHQAACNASKKEQLSSWQQELLKYEQELSQLQREQDLVYEDAKNYEVRAPVSGILQGLAGMYAGGQLAAGTTIASLSPETELIAECDVSTNEIGLLKKGQEVTFQVDAYDYNFFGTITGRVLSIDNDVTPTENRDVFKVRCSFNKKQLHLKNGFPGELKKGLDVRARFIIARRSLWNLLFDKLDDWVNPSKA